jgi:hypothetical protein
MQLVHRAAAAVQTKVVANLEQQPQVVAAELLPLVALVELQTIAQLLAAHFLAEPVVLLVVPKAALAAAAVTLAAAAVLIKLQLLASTVVAVVARGI